MHSIQFSCNLIHIHYRYLFSTCNFTRVNSLQFEIAVEIHFFQKYLNLSEPTLVFHTHTNSVVWENA